ncbi:MAG: hypothetical protein MMC23_009992, partial [Stictis urceolatum]|nr:hypothetical protein [Stictis urceolata]
MRLQLPNSVGVNSVGVNSSANPSISAGSNKRPAQESVKESHHDFDAASSNTKPQRVESCISDNDQARSSCNSLSKNASASGPVPSQIAGSDKQLSEATETTADAVAAANRIGSSTLSSELDESSRSPRRYDLDGNPAYIVPIKLGTIDSNGRFSSCDPKSTAIKEVFERLFTKFKKASLSRTYLKPFEQRRFKDLHFFDDRPYHYERFMTYAYRALETLNDEQLKSFERSGTDPGVVELKFQILEF